MEKRTEYLGLGHFRTEDGREIKFVPTENENEWESVQVNEVVELTEQEKNKATALGWDIEKVLKVKSLLRQEVSPSEIQKRTGISRNSVYKYQKILSVKDSKIKEKDNKSTVISKSVFPNWLIFLVVANQSTHSTILVLSPLLLLAVVGYVKIEYDKWKRDLEEHRTKVSFLKIEWGHVFDLSFRKYPLFVESEKEKIHYEKLLKHYNNSSRDVIVIERGYRQSAWEHELEREGYEKAYCSANRQMLDEAEANSTRIWNELQVNGYFDYLSAPKGKNWEMSKHYIEKHVEFYRQNPMPVKDTARKKEILTDLDFIEL